MDDLYPLALASICQFIYTCESDNPKRCRLVCGMVCAMHRLHRSGELCISLPMGTLCTVAVAGYLMHE
jgi:hypothetical protein